MRKDKRKITSDKERKRHRRKLSIRSTLSGTTERPRVCAIRTNKHIGLAVVDDSLGKTIFSLHSYGKEKVEGISKTMEGAKLLGETVAQKLQDKGIGQVVFDRNGFKYHGIVAQLAEGLRSKGIKV